MPNIGQTQGPHQLMEGDISIEDRASHPVDDEGTHGKSDDRTDRAQTAPISQVPTLSDADAFDPRFSRNATTITRSQAVVVNVVSSSTSL